MPILTQCPDCGQKLRVPDDLLGKRVKCPGCKVTFTAADKAPQLPAPPPPPVAAETPAAPPPMPPPTESKPGVSAGIAALDNLDLDFEDDAKPAPPPPANKPPPMPGPATKPPESPKIAALDNLNLELDDEPKPPPATKAPAAPVSKAQAPPPPSKPVEKPKPEPGKKLDEVPVAKILSKPKPEPARPLEEDEIAPEPMKPVPAKPMSVRAKATVDDDREPCPHCGELIKQGATRCKHCGEDLDEREDDRPSRRGGSRRDSGRSRRDAAPHRGGLIMTLGIISVCLLITDLPFCCCLTLFTEAAGLGLGIPAWLMGHKDLASMKAGLMDERGRGSTQTGCTCGMIGTIIHGLMLLLSIGWFLFSVIINGASMMAGPSFSPGPSPGPGRRFEVPQAVPRLHEYLPSTFYHPAPPAGR